MSWAAPRLAVTAAGILLALGSSTSAFAQTWRVTPSIAVGTTFSDNVALQPDSLAESGWIFDVTPRIGIEHLGPRSTVFVDYRRHSLFYTTDRPSDETQQFLDAYVRWKSIDNFLTVDARATITQQPRSPFAGAVTPDVATSSRNRGETRLYEVAPSVRGFLGSFALYQLRFAETDADTRRIGVPRTRSSSASGSMRSASPSSVLGWSVDASALQVRNTVIGELEDSRIRGTLVIAALPAVRLSLSGGYEETDFLGTAQKRLATSGAGLDWLPSERTQLSAAWEKRFFGDGYNLFLAHRTPLTAWRLTASRDISVLPNQLAASNLRAVSSLLSDLLASAQPDPVQRAALVRARMEESFLPETSTLSSGLFSARPFLLKSIEGSAALVGRRNTLTLAFTRREQVGLGESGGAVAADNVRRSGVTANWAYRLTPLTTFSLATSYLRTDGLFNTELQATDRAVSALWATRLGPHTTFSIGARRTDLRSTAILDYAENAVVVIFATRL